MTRAEAIWIAWDMALGAAVMLLACALVGGLIWLLEWRVRR